jgi:hypothetical protein
MSGSGHDLSRPDAEWGAAGAGERRWRSCCRLLWNGLGFRGCGRRCMDGRCCTRGRGWFGGKVMSKVQKFLFGLAVHTTCQWHVSEVYKRNRARNCNKRVMHAWYTSGFFL